MAEVADFVQPQSAAIDVVAAVRRYAACGPVLLSLVTRNRGAVRIASRRADAMSAPGILARRRVRIGKNALNAKIASGSDVPNLRPPV
jgi:hypothetical protein